MSECVDLDIRTCSPRPIGNCNGCAAMPAPDAPSTCISEGRSRVRAGHMRHQSSGHASGLVIGSYLEIPSRKVLRSLRLLILFHSKGGLDDNETTTDKHSMPPPAHAGMRQPRRVLRVHTVSLTDQPTQRDAARTARCSSGSSSGKLARPSSYPHPAIGTPTRSVVDEL